MDTPCYTSWIFTALGVVVPSLLFVLMLQIWARKKTHADVLRKHHDVTGFTFSIIGVLYSVILGFTVVSSKDRYNNVEQNILTETFSISDLYRDAGYFSIKERDLIRNYLRSYVKVVTEKEWNIRDETPIFLESDRIVEKLWDVYYNIEVKNTKMEIWYGESIAKLNTFINAGLARQFSASQRLGSMMWCLLISGGIITVGFMFFFVIENFRIQILMTALLTGYLSFMLFLIYSLDYLTESRPTSFVRLVELFDEWDNGV
ncbi:MAG: DUF4239 domain-containing protein [Chlamydiae bacterium]|nr:DUF4239 domain-containing protein [Chlamydiota bacterium]